MGVERRRRGCDTGRMSDIERIDRAIDELLEQHDPSSMSGQEFRGHQFDANLAIINFPEGEGGMGLSPKLRSEGVV